MSRYGTGYRYDSPMTAVRSVYCPVCRKRTVVLQHDRQYRALTDLKNYPFVEGAVILTDLCCTDCVAIWREKLRQVNSLYLDQDDDVNTCGVLGCLADRAARRITPT